MAKAGSIRDRESCDVYNRGRFCTCCNLFSRLFCFSEYVLSFCMANNKECPSPKQVNECFTQQISYARREIKRATGKLAEANY